MGGIVSMLGTVLMFYGSYQQAQEDKDFQNTIGNYVEKQQSEDAPDIVALTVEKKGADYFLVVQNVGRKPAAKVKLIFSEKSTPGIFAGNLISGAQEIPQNTKYTLPLNLFTGVNLVMKATNSVPEYKGELEASLRKFNAGEMAFIPRFYIEYYHGEKKMTSPMYYLVLEKRDGPFYFGKED